MLSPKVNKKRSLMALDDPVVRDVVQATLVGGSGGPGPIVVDSPMRNLCENKPGEPPFQMVVQPDSKIAFRSNNLFGGTPTVVDCRITNTTQFRQTFKVKCTSNEIFRVEPPLGFVAPGDTVFVKIAFQSSTPPERSKHFFAIHHMRVKAEDQGKPVRQLWSIFARPEGVKRIPATFEREDGTSYL